MSDASPKTAVNYSITPGAISVIVLGKHRLIPRSHQNFDRLAAELRRPTEEKDLDLICELADISTFIARKTMGDVQIGDGKVRWRGQEVHGVIVERILDLMKHNHDLEPLTNFLGRLMQNPLEGAREDLFEWLEAGNAPITPEGNFLAFKKVRQDYKDIHSGMFDNSVGKEPKMPREQVDPDRRNECSRGLHFCSFGYLAHFGNGGDNRTMIVEVDPADVVSIPNDYNRQKGRTWRYKVIGEVQNEQAVGFYENRPLVQPVYIHDPDAAEYVAPSTAKEVLVSEGDEVRFIGVEEDMTDGEYYTVVDFRGGFISVNNDMDELTEFPVSVFSVDDEENDDFNDFEPDTRVGESVVCISDTYTFFTPGALYVVLDHSDDGEPEVVDDDGDHTCLGEGEYRLAEPADLEAAKAALNPTKDDIPASKNAAEKQFFCKTNGRSFLESEIISLVKEHGQRGTMRLTGIPRTTLQLWLAAIKG